MAGPGLTPKQARFVQEYLVDLNATAAYRRAGYDASGNAAEASAWRLLRNAKVQRAIQEAQHRLANHVQVTQERIIQELATIGFSDVTHYALDEVLHLKPTATAPKAAMRAVASVKHRVRIRTHGEDTESIHDVEFRLWDKNTALVNLGKHLGLFKDKSADDIPTLRIILERLYERDGDQTPAPVQGPQLPATPLARDDNGHAAGGLGSPSPQW
jgi:phage terminase small subunit